MSNSRYELSGTDTSPLDRRAVKLLYAGTAKYGSDWHSTLHTHTCMELFYVTGGAGYFRIAGRTIPAATDDLITVSPHVEHTELGPTTNPMEYIVLGVQGLEFSAGEEGDSRYSIVNFSRSRAEILQYMRSLIREIEEKPDGYQIVCQDLLEVLVVRLMRHADFLLELDPDLHKSSKECSEVHWYIDSHFKENITLDLLAERAHVNKYYLVHTFSREYGISPISYLITRRIQESRYLLADTDHSLSQISQMLGFSSPSYFSQSFRRLVGTSPMEYRKQQRTAEK